MSPEGQARASWMEAPPAGAAATNGATSTSPSTRSFSCRPSKELATRALDPSPVRLRENPEPRCSTVSFLSLCLCLSCQFVVTDEQDYQAHFTDPDTLVNWDCVQQVVSGLCSSDMSPTYLHTQHASASHSLQHCVSLQVR